MSSQAYITRNRAPRVHITYEVYTGDAMKKVELPFIAMVWSDLSGKSASELAPVADRKSIDIHADNFDQVLKSQKPRVSFLVDNHLTGEGKLPIDITFEKLSDFEPGAVARKVDSLRQLLEVRQTLDNLLGVIGGKPKAEELFEKIRKSPELLGSLVEEAKRAGAAAPKEETPEA
jgi:type VI secretion system protein ImpB